MQTKTNTNIERIIAKIDNDFNPDNSDWIPRVAAWCIQAMQMLDCLPTEKKKIKISVKDRIAYSPCINDEGNISIYDECGQKVKRADNTTCGCSNSSTGKETRIETAITANTVCASYNSSIKAAPDMVAQTVNTKDYPARYNVVEKTLNGSSQCEHNYVIVDNNKIELNWDTDYITLEYEAIKTCSSSVYGCDVPVIPNNGVLIEALGYYCVYKMLCRGYKHPVFNLAASQYGTNPYYMWNELKEEAKRSILINGITEDASHLFRSSFFIQTFDSRH